MPLIYAPIPTQHASTANAVFATSNSFREVSSRKRTYSRDTITFYYIYSYCFNNKEVRMNSKV